MATNTASKTFIQGQSGGQCLINGAGHVGTRSNLLGRPSIQELTEVRTKCGVAPCLARCFCLHATQPGCATARQPLAQAVDIEGFYEGLAIGIHDLDGDGC